MTLEKPPRPPAQQPNPPQRVLIFGCGYLGERVAGLARARGDDVVVTTRRAEKARSLTDAGFAAVVADWTDRRTLTRLPSVDRVLVAVSYDRRSPHSRRDAVVGGFSNLLGVLGETAKVCYISTTGVYHQSDGSWVDETSPARPGRDAGSAHLSAESMLWRQRPHAPWTILRLAGIYGPQRVPRAADVIAGRPIASRPDGFLNLIHVDDAARAVLASWETSAERLYLVADDRPVRRGEFYREIARQTGSPQPTFVAPEPGTSAQQRSESNKRIWNRRMTRDLVSRLKYPSYREGLAQVLSRTPLTT